ncbi:hypothetical protein [Sinobaca sp. H24]|uniref:hypothetical protein n=1 Tax=Sinobaca sp. H24 TaxID=2923376 RepID=UPI002079A1F4|nr:hypothetical protein [Sinobaca sp. H24]
MWWVEFNHDGPGFDPFGPAHLLVFAIVILSCACLLIWRRPIRRSQAFQKRSAGQLPLFFWRLKYGCTPGTF